MPSKRGAFFGEHPEDGKLYVEKGVCAEFRRLTNKHFKDLERELGTKNPPDYIGEYVVSEKDSEA